MTGKDYYILSWDETKEDGTIIPQKIYCDSMKEMLKRGMKLDEREDVHNLWAETQHKWKD